MRQEGRRRTSAPEAIAEARGALEAGRLSAALAAAERAVAEADRAPQREARTHARRLLARALVAKDRAKEAQSVAVEAVRIARAARSAREEALAELAVAEALVAQGLSMDALRHAARGRKLAHKSGHRPTLLASMRDVAALLAQLGDDDRARTLFDETLAEADAHLSPPEAAGVLLAAAVAHRAAGRGALALALLERAAGAARAHGAAVLAYDVALARVRVWLEASVPERAREALRAARAPEEVPAATRAHVVALHASIALAESERHDRIDELLDEAAAWSLETPARLALERVRAASFLARGRAEEAERIAVGIAAVASKGGMRAEAAYGLAIAAKAGSPDAWLLRWLGALSLSSAGVATRIEHEAMAALASEPEPIGQLARNGLAITRARLVDHAPEEAKRSLQRSLRLVESRVLALRQSRRAGAEVSLDAALLKAKEEAGIAGASPSLLRAIGTVARAARSDASLVLTGETGSGKELFARFVHRLSARANGPFVAINCAAIAEPLLEGELFGHERGAFTGAERARRGLFLEAEGGTLFLDEVGEMSPAMQVKLLRVLEDREVRAVGSNRSRKVDVRVVAATHRDLATMVAQEKFRQDLFYRLAAITVRIPSLRERPEDVPTIARALLARDPETKSYRFDVPALTALAGHTWPGNVRELANVLRVAAAMCEGTVIGGPDIQRAIDSGASRLEASGARAFDETTLSALRARHRAEVRELVGRALASADGNKLRAARALGVSRQGLYRVLSESS
jgi:DNA-binding NtrC family response regulator